MTLRAGEEKKTKSELVSSRLVASSCLGHGEAAQAFGWLDCCKRDQFIIILPFSLASMGSQCVCMYMGPTLGLRRHKSTW